MSDFYDGLLKKSIERQAREIVSDGATEQDRYGHILESINVHDLKQEQVDKIQQRVTDLRIDVAKRSNQRKQDELESSMNLQKRIMNVKIRKESRVNDFLERNKEHLEKGKESIRREQSRLYFS